MKIEKTSNKRIQIIFNIEDLLENNITLQSFLSNSESTKNFIRALIEIAEEELKLSFTKAKGNYEIFSFNNKKFVIAISNRFSSNITRNNCLLYKFDSYNDLTPFCVCIKEMFSDLNFNSSLYKYKNTYYLRLFFDDEKKDNLNLVASLLSEFYNNLQIDNLTLSRLNEFSETVIKNNAIEAFA
jgi:negative regulator of genetic competence, sporulation and motility